MKEFTDNLGSTAIAILSNTCLVMATSSFLNPMVVLGAKAAASTGYYFYLNKHKPERQNGQSDEDFRQEIGEFIEKTDVAADIATSDLCQIGGTAIGLVASGHSSVLAITLSSTMLSAGCGMATISEPEDWLPSKSLAAIYGFMAGYGMTLGGVEKSVAEYAKQVAGATGGHIFAKACKWLYNECREQSEYGRV